MLKHTEQDKKFKFFKDMIVSVLVYCSKHWTLYIYIQKKDADKMKFSELGCSIHLMRLKKKNCAILLAFKYLISIRISLSTSSTNSSVVDE